MRAITASDQICLAPICALQRTLYSSVALPLSNKLSALSRNVRDCDSEFSLFDSHFNLNFVDNVEHRFLIHDLDKNFTSDLLTIKINPLEVFILIINQDARVGLFTMSLQMFYSENWK